MVDLVVLLGYIPKSWNGDALHVTNTLHL